MTACMTMFNNLDVDIEIGVDIEIEIDSESKEKIMKKSLQEVREAFLGEVFDYIEDCGFFTKDEVAARTAAYSAGEWKFVEASYIANDIRTGTCTDFTADFVCRMLAGRV